MKPFAIERERWMRQKTRGYAAMLRRLIGRMLHPNPVLAIFGVFISIWTGWQVLNVLRGDPGWANLDKLSTSKVARLLGLLIILYLVVRSLVNDLWNGFGNQKRIICGIGQPGTTFDYRNLLLRDPNIVFVVAQNMRTLLSDRDYLPSVSQWLDRNRHRNPRLTFILSTPKALEAINPTAMRHLKQSVSELRDFLTSLDAELRERITIRFHAAATSLSAFVCDPADRLRGILTFTPKWALDTEPGNRLYCVLERWEHDELFSRVTGTIPAMVQSEGFGLNEVCAELQI